MNITKGLPIDEKLINVYKEKLPQQLIEIWSKYGFGQLLDGYLRIIDPAEYTELLNETYFRADVSIPIFTTAFGDIITFEKNKYIGIVRYKNHDFNILASDMEMFFLFLDDDYFIKSKFNYKEYINAKKVLGDLSNDECYGYFPVPCAGGKEVAENIKKVKTKEHIYFISELVGKIGER